MGVKSCLWLHLIVLCTADIYLHNPRGGNNRLDERAREVANENRLLVVVFCLPECNTKASRLFDSQNNRRGGYNVGSLYYYAGSIVPIEWTSQHSCKDPNNRCELIIQYMCSPNLRDGIRTNAIPEENSDCKNEDCNKDFRYGMHEDHDYYTSCKYRERNMGLFTADQALKGKTAKYTRQNPQGTRRGYECPEERDYYPYWKSSPWKDIVVFTDDVTRCEYYIQESQNVKARSECIPPKQYYDYAKRKNLPIPDDKAACEAIMWPINDPNGEKANWTVIPAHNLAPPECFVTQWSRDNHLGNGIGGYPNTYHWTVPDTPNEYCALRIRYNISSSDYDGWNTNASSNGSPETKVDIGKLVGLKNEDAAKRGYVFKQNPVIKPVAGTLSDKLPLRLAINTNQYGRVFQDRTHSFAIRKRPDNLNGKRVLNVNVRGKRGNIVQVFPSVEYDFVPNTLSVSTGDYIHFQWTGSNTNNEQNDGQGLLGSDRNNVVLLEAPRYAETSSVSAAKYGHWGNNYPEHANKTIFLGLDRSDLEKLAYLEPGHFRGELSELDDAGTYFDLGPRKVTETGTYHYMCTRNNNFSNRSQKGKIIVISTPAVDKLIGWSGGQLVLQDGIQGVWVEKDSLKDSTNFRLEEWAESEGESYLRSKGSRMNLGDSYASNYLSVQPAGQLTRDGKLITVKLKVKDGKFDTVRLYRSVDAMSWSEVKGVKYSDGVASFRTDKGGLFVARGHRNYGLIAGAVVAVVIVLILIIGLIVYFRRRPQSWRSLQMKVRTVKRSFQNTV